MFELVERYGALPEEIVQVYIAELASALGNNIFVLHIHDNTYLLLSDYILI